MNDTQGAARTPAVTILVADDTRDVALVVAKLLETAGYGAICAHSGREVLDLLDEHSEVSLVLSDIRMPGIDGFDLLRVLKHRFPALPVILMTGMPITEYDDAPTGAAVLNKPFGMGDLERAIQEKLAPNRT